VPALSAGTAGPKSSGDSRRALKTVPLLKNSGDRAARGRRILHAPPTCQTEHGDGLLRLPGGLSPAVEKTFFLLIALGQRERTCSVPGDTCVRTGIVVPVGGTIASNCKRITSCNGEVTARHREGAPLPRHAGPLFDGLAPVPAAMTTRS
jgi:hypothetical protein